MHDLSNCQTVQQYSALDAVYTHKKALPQELQGHVEDILNILHSKAATAVLQERIQRAQYSHDNNTASLPLHAIPTYRQTARQYHGSHTHSLHIESVHKSQAKGQEKRNLQMYLTGDQYESSIKVHP